MALELITFPVENVQFSNRTFYEKGILELNKDELISLILEDNRIKKADIDIAFPGEKTRIVNVRDAVEPRVKVSGASCLFPGILGDIERVGHGRTHRLSGMTIMPSAQYKATILSGNVAQNSGIVDMWGPASEVTPFGSTINVVPIFELIDNITELDAHAAIQLAELKLSHKIAETTLKSNSGSMETFDLSKVDPSLPRVIYILSFMTYRSESLSLIFYNGMPIRDSMPFLINPTELFDGVITTDTRQGHGRKATTWQWQNNPIALGLLREHGKRLNFLGVILQITRFESETGKKVSAGCASGMAKLLEADGAIITRTTASGANFEDVMITLQACERNDIKTVMLGPEWGNSDGTEPPLVMYVPEATALVSSGSHESEVIFPRADKVIGVKENQLLSPEQGDKPFAPWDEFNWKSYYGVTGGPDWFGNGKITCKEY